MESRPFRELPAAFFIAPRVVVCCQNPVDVAEGTADSVAVAIAVAAAAARVANVELQGVTPCIGNDMEARRKLSTNASTAPLPPPRTTPGAMDMATGETAALNVPQDEI